MRYLILLLCCFGWVTRGCAQSALSKEVVFPTGFYSSGKYCIPIKDDAKPSMMRAGQCPTGYYARGKNCVAPRKDGQPPVSKDGQCPIGYYTSGAQCLKSN
jgi:hypothetical protein